MARPQSRARDRPARHQSPTTALRRASEKPVPGDWPAAASEPPPLRRHSCRIAPFCGTIERQRKAPMQPNERLGFSAIAERQPLVLPEGARLAVWVIVNVEEWDIRQAMPRTVIT